MKFFKDFLSFFVHIWSSRKLLLALIIYDFKKQYLGSYLGLSWAFIQPIIFISVIWVVFELGFRIQPLEIGVPFAIWLIVGIVPWFFFSDAISSGTNSIVSNAFLVKKVAFRVSILPLVNIGSSMIIHLGLVFFLIIIMIFNGFWPSLFWIQMPFYMSLTILFTMGLSWFTCAIRVFVKDVISIILVFLQMGFWLTPIFWSIDLVPEKYHYLIKLNPVYFVVDGYRDSFINQIWFWEKPYWSLYFLFNGVIVFALGALIFKRLRPHFADVL